MKTIESKSKAQSIMATLLVLCLGLVTTACPDNKKESSRIAQTTSGRDRSTLGWENCRDCEEFQEELIAGWGESIFQQVEIGFAVYGDLLYQDFRAYRGPVAAEGYLLVREPITGPQCVFPAGSYEIFSQVGGQYNAPGDHFLLRNLPMEAIGSGRRLGFYIIRADFDPLATPINAPDGYTYHLSAYGALDLCGLQIQLGKNPQ